jgi:putative ABC transport system permease protein
MNSILLIRISLRSIAAHKWRSILTILGIVIGIATIISTLAIGQGVARKQQQKFESMGRNFIAIEADNFMTQGQVKSNQRKKQVLFTPEDCTYLKNQCDKITYISPQVNNKIIISNKDHHLETSVQCGNQDLLTILDKTIEQGTCFSKEQAELGELVIVLGHKAAQVLFPLENALERLVTIAKNKYRVIGILTHQTEFFGAANPDLEVYIPLKTAQRKMGDWCSNKFYCMALSITQKSEMQQASSEITALLRIRRAIEPEDLNNFLIHDLEAIAKAAAEAIGMLNLFIIFIASISLLIAAVGIMNIMLVSVTERTREIGIRMALGAPRNIILRQFLFEAITLTMLGGIGGVLVGIGISHLIGYLLGWMIIITPASVIGAFITTTLIGLFFGYYPATKAANLDPIIALAER